jgi:hypothetical protein
MRINTQNLLSCRIGKRKKNERFFESIIFNESYFGKYSFTAKVELKDKNTLRKTIHATLIYK